MCISGASQAALDRTKHKNSPTRAGLVEVSIKHKLICDCWVCAFVCVCVILVTMAATSALWLSSSTSSSLLLLLSLLVCLSPLHCLQQHHKQATSLHFHGTVGCWPGLSALPGRCSIWESWRCYNVESTHSSFYKSYFVVAATQNRRRQYKSINVQFHDDHQGCSNATISGFYSLFVEAFRWGGSLDVAFFLSPVFFVWATSLTWEPIGDRSVKRFPSPVDSDVISREHVGVCACVSVHIRSNTHVSICLSASTCLVCVGEPHLQSDQYWL